jgi:predicted nucleic acid-binding protein
LLEFLDNIDAKQRKSLMSMPFTSEIAQLYMRASPDRRKEYIERYIAARVELSGSVSHREVFLGDLTPIANSVEKLVRTAKNAGISAVWTSKEEDDKYQIIIELPKKSLRAVRFPGAARKAGRNIDCSS